MYSVYICATTDIVTVLRLVDGARGGIWGETTRICEMLVSYKPLAPQLTALFVAVLAVYGSDDSDSDALACLLALRTHMHGLKHA